MTGGDEAERRGLLFGSGGENVGGLGNEAAEVESGCGKVSSSEFPCGSMVAVGTLSFRGERHRGVNRRERLEEQCHKCSGGSELF